MSVGSGIAASFGIVDETVFGTAVAVNRWLPGTQFFVRPDIGTEPITGLAAGRMGYPGEVVVSKRGTGQWQGQVPTVKWSLFLKHLMGTAPAPAQQGGTAAYKHAYTLADNFGKSFTAQVGVPLTTGTVQPYTGTGGKVTAIELSSDVNTPLTATVDMVFQNVVDSIALAAPSYVANGVLGGGQGPAGQGLTVSLGTFGAEAAVSGIRSASVKLERMLDNERPGAVGAGPEPIMIGEGFKVSGTLAPDFQSKADFADRFIANTGGSLVLNWQGALIASTYYYGLKVTCPMVRFRDAVPGVDGPDIVKGSVAFDAFTDATNGLVLVDYTTTDTTI